MLVHVPALLDRDALATVRALVADGPWGDGKATAGTQSAQAKNNRQLPEDCTQAAQAREEMAKVFEDDVSQALIPFVDKNFRTLTDRDNRAMAGLSMGGFQTFSITTKHLDLFSYIGGFSGIGGMHGDHHGLWIDPANPAILYNANDGGFYQSEDAGKTWKFAVTAAGAQFYNVTLDTSSPHWAYGSIQDHGSRRGRTGRISVVLIRCSVASRITVEMPAPTEASVMATSTASSTINKLAIRKL